MFDSSVCVVVGLDVVCGALALDAPSLTLRTPFWLCLRELSGCVPRCVLVSPPRFLSHAFSSLHHALELSGRMKTFSTSSDKWVDVKRQNLTAPRAPVAGDV